MKKLAILGAAESGVGTAILAQKQGWDVFVSDFGGIKEEYKDTLNRHNLRWEEGHHTEEEILSADAVVKSPGIPDTAPIVQRLIEKGTPILAELEFARQYSRGKTICITGSNGKTTTTRLIYYIMQRWGVDVGLAGNIGRSYALQVAEGDHDWYVLEISSFQLDNMFDFRADVSVLISSFVSVSVLCSILLSVIDAPFRPCGLVLICEFSLRPSSSPSSPPQGLICMLVLLN